MKIDEKLKELDFEVKCAYKEYLETEEEYNSLKNTVDSFSLRQKDLENKLLKITKINFYIFSILFSTFITIVSFIGLPSGNTLNFKIIKFVFSFLFGTSSLFFCNYFRREIEKLLLRISPNVKVLLRESNDLVNSLANAVTKAQKIDKKLSDSYNKYLSLKRDQVELERKHYDIRMCNVEMVLDTKFDSTLLTEDDKFQNKNVVKK